MTFVESGSNDTGCGTHFSSKQSPNGNSAFTVESEISFPIRFHIWFVFFRFRTSPKHRNLSLKGCRTFDAAVTWQSHVTPRGSGWNSRFKNKCFKRLTSREFRGESRGDLETREEASL
ncbi:hypothetical protein H5410_020730 [Solanum commersonii]|uniref:Uncharacterized protein n=1 Tax=Solanum commersonii TaxID=4109 RepID=A0A9J5Z9A4_SOLCO|nr:hypothetical protein H5410_020730 [Solanum commersonii]